MSATSKAQHPVVDALLDRLGQVAAADRLELVRAFARAYLRRVPGEVLDRLGVEELTGQILGVFRFADERRSPIAVRAFTPSLAGDGYETAGSVIETSVVDSPFLVDSVTATIESLGVPIRLVIHPIVGVERGPSGEIATIVPARQAAAAESVMHFELGLALQDDALEQIEQAIRQTLADVAAVVADFARMKHAVAEMTKVARAGAATYGEAEAEEAAAFLDWLLEDNFVLLGYREYVIADRSLAIVPSSGLGILADETSSHYAEPVPLKELDADLRARVTGGDLLVVTKTNRHARVHRHVRMDYVGVKRLSRGKVVGELRLLGLFTSHADTEPASEIPILRRKLSQIVENADLLPATHDYKTAVELFESFPKDTLFATPASELEREILSLIELQEREQVRLFMRELDGGRRVSVLIAMPRDRFNAALRRSIQSLLKERIGGSSVDAHLDLGHAEQARLHFTVHVDRGRRQVAISELEREVIALTRTWDDRLRERLVQMHGETVGSALAERYAGRLPEAYKSSVDVYLACLDIAAFERLESGDRDLVVALQNEHGSGRTLTRVGLYSREGKISLSQVVPLLEHLGLEVVEEIPTRLVGQRDTFLHDFGVLGPDGAPLDVTRDGDRVAAAVEAAHRGELESDALQRLVIAAGLDWRQIVILRAYRKYRQRVAPTFTEAYEHDAFARNAEITRALVELFELRFDPDRIRDEEAEDRLRARILSLLDAVRSLDDDRILRSQLGLVDATVRTNAYVPGRAWVSFKFDSARVPDLPKPVPVAEIFVYAPSMEGIHLRGGRVARGGIRWSDRREDYRTEVLGLMKAQMVKNAVIVPVGSKGGFVLKRPPTDREALRADVAAQYSILIRGMLDVTDTLVDGASVTPTRVRALDDGDPYLVVAADKGTATFSDLANGIATEYGFWLGDAFASGGSAGYDHKGLGITARGAFESVKRHFRELGLDVVAEPFTVVGIGDMSGDVFGNGMLLSPQIRLVAAFDHRHVFVDPDPDPAVGFAERSRLFALPGSSWDDYDRERISAGGGVFALTEKSIVLTPEMRASLGVDAATMTPTELKAAVLRAPVDLFWNGGIGTFVKGHGEPNATVGDRTNDAIRADADELRVRVVGEGGNLGFTQQARIEFAQRGGRINTDAVDNSAGVDCSDHEVNLKILLGLAETAGDLTRKQRDELLQQVSDDVCRHVLYDNYQQAQILSQEELVAASRLDASADLMTALEARGLLDREVEGLPSDEQVVERRRERRGLTRPELAVLMAYAKRGIKDDILASDLPDDPYLERELAGYFPRAIAERFAGLLPQHPLRRELIATIVANDIVNCMGITFVTRFAGETGATSSAVARAYWAAREATGAVDRWQRIEALDGTIDPIEQNALMTIIDSLVEDVARWCLLHGKGDPLGETIETMREPFTRLGAQLARVGSDAWRQARLARAASIRATGVDEAFALEAAFAPELAHGPDIIDVAALTGRSLDDTTEAFVLAGELIDLDRLEELSTRVAPEGRWERWAGLAVDDDLLAIRRELARRALEAAPDAAPGEALRHYIGARAEVFGRVARTVAAIEADDGAAVAALSVAVRQLRSAVGS